HVKQLMDTQSEEVGEIRVEPGEAAPHPVAEYRVQPGASPLHPPEELTCPAPVTRIERNGSSIESRIQQITAAHVRHHGGSYNTCGRYATVAVAGTAPSPASAPTAAACALVSAGREVVGG